MQKYVVKNTLHMLMSSNIFKNSTILSSSSINDDSIFSSSIYFLTLSKDSLDALKRTILSR